MSKYAFILALFSTIVLIICSCGGIIHLYLFFVKKIKAGKLIKGRIVKVIITSGIDYEIRKKEWCTEFTVEVRGLLTNADVNRDVLFKIKSQ